MSSDLLLKSIAHSGQTVVRNVKSYDFKLQQVSSLLSGFIESYGNIVSAFAPNPTSLDVDWNRCIASKSNPLFPHCTAVQSFVVDISVIGSIGAFSLLVAVVAICWINRLIIPMMQGAGSERIKEDDEVILELDMSSVGAAVAKPKRRAATPATVAHILIFSMFMICGIGALATALCAQIMAISDAERVWGNLSHSSGDFQEANIRTVSRLNQSLFNSTAFLNVILAESKSSIETRWLDAQNTTSHRNKTFISWKRLSKNVTNVTEAFFSRLQKSGSCVSCRNEELLVASVDFEGGTVIPSISVANPAAEFWNNSAVRSSFNILQSTYANMSVSFGNFPLFMDESNVVLGKIVKAIFAFWSLEITCILSKCVLTIMAIRILHRKHLNNVKKMPGTDADDQELFGHLIKMSRLLKWSAMFGITLSSVLWICSAFSFSIGRYFDEICVGMEYTSPMYRVLQGFIFDASTAKYLVSCASASENNIHFDAPLSAVIDQLAPYNLSGAYNIWGVVDQVDKQLKQSQSAVAVKSSLSLETALDSYSNYGRQMFSYLTLVNELSNIQCFWGNISLCHECRRCTSLSEQLDFRNKHNSLIGVESSVVAIDHALRLEAAGLVAFVEAASKDQRALQNFRLALTNEVRKSSEAVRSVTGSLIGEWKCLGVNNALPHYGNFKSGMCEISSKSATAIIHISWVTFAISALVFQWISFVFLYLAVHLLLSASEFGGWTKKDIMNKPTKALNDISLSAMEPYYPAQFSVAGAARETELVENLNASQVVQTNSMSAPRRFVPLSAPARGSVTM